MFRSILKKISLGFVLLLGLTSMLSSYAQPMTDTHDIVNANTQFAFEFHQTVAGNQNIIASPYSLSTALAMTYAGARAATEMQMAQVLHWMMPQEAVHQGYYTLNSQLGLRSTQMGGGNAMASHTMSPTKPSGLSTNPNNPLHMEFEQALNQMREEHNLPLDSVGAEAPRLEPIQTPGQTTPPALVLTGDRNAQMANTMNYDDNGFSLNIANALWMQEGYSFLTSYLDTLERYYGALPQLADFRNNREEARQRINGWAEQQTNNKIKNLVPDGVLTAATRLVLTNAIYFKGAWFYPFEERNTTPMPFYLTNGQQVNVPMMAQANNMNYAETPTLQLAELPYENRDYAMVLVLPRPGQSLSSVANAPTVTGALNNTVSTRVALRMPKFSFETPIKASDALANMGMPDAFTPFKPAEGCDKNMQPINRAADFSNMDGTRCLYIQDVLHKAFIDVNEAGTEAAAATAVVIGITRTALPTRPVEMTLDRPFLFMIQHKPTGTVLFMGQVTNPLN